ncbi:hypothetical protein FVE85_0185 [Porphyridium purpureum]|uniref:Uncharacterized protein n=1 Tax=Porphyridium purpureum TaxID=35688 RepID=A0A5J4YYR8_PORPP|nr:hypothetical protein FVE85_0185 [Porphyridium purpureum]|eukprot:POR2113..scf208_2
MDRMSITELCRGKVAKTPNVRTASTRSQACPLEAADSIARRRRVTHLLAAELNVQSCSGACRDRRKQDQRDPKIGVLTSKYGLWHFHVCKELQCYPSPCRSLALDAARFGNLPRSMEMFGTCSVTVFAHTTRTRQALFCPGAPLGDFPEVKHSSACRRTLSVLRSLQDPAMPRLNKAGFTHMQFERQRFAEAAGKKAGLVIGVLASDWNERDVLVVHRRGARIKQRLAVVTRYHERHATKAPKLPGTVCLTETEYQVQNSDVQYVRCSVELGTKASRKETLEENKPCPSSASPLSSLWEQGAGKYSAR